MNKKNILILLVLLLLAGITFSALGAVKVYADQIGDRSSVLTLTRSVIGSGGMGGSAGGYTLHSTLGQPVAGSVVSGDYTFTSGFWAEVVGSIVAFFNFLPLILQ